MDMSYEYDRYYGDVDDDYGYGYGYGDDDDYIEGDVDEDYYDEDYD